MIRNKLNKFILLFSLLILLTGCWDQIQIDRSSYVVAIGIDKAEKEGQIKLTYLITNPEYGPQQQTNKAEPPSRIMTFIVDDLISAKDIASTVTSKIITYDILRYIFVSEELAQEKNIIRWMYDFSKDIEIRRDSNFIVTKEAAGKYLENSRPPFEQKPYKYFELSIENSVKSGMIPVNSQLLHYYRVMEANDDLFLAIYSTTEENDTSTKKDEDNFTAGELHVEGQPNKNQFAGSALFNSGKMIGKLTGSETRLSILLNHTLDAPDMLTTFPDPFDDRYRIAASMNSIKPVTVKMDLEGKTPTISVHLPLKIDLLTNHSMTDYTNNLENIARLKSSIQANLTDKMELLIKKTQEEFKAQPFGWSLIARKEFNSIPKFEAFNWKKKYPDMDVDISITIEIGQFGTQSSVPNIKEVKE
ncbi:MAG TPA: Ger(x)C family spore germination protein [Virgibacillus sp.]|nr:Ger(x)C family spore germination protein [Virgibacillus sp.]